MRPTTRALAFFAVIPAFVSLLTGGACSSSNNDNDASIPVGSGGQKATGGAAGSATGGKGGGVGTGGRATGGAGGGPSVGGAPGSGGGARIDGGLGTGGLGAGGRGTGGAIGSGGTVGLDAGRFDGGVDLVVAEAGARAEAGREAPSDERADQGGADGLPDTPMGGGLDSCFAGLPAQVGIQMIATKSTADGRVRMRIALDTEDRGGTSGTLGWAVIRLAVEVDGVVACITDRSAFRYTPSHHNCTDTATATAGTTTYSIAAPDRPTATLTITGGASTGPYTLTDTTCTMFWSAGAQITCRSGGPC